MLRQYCLMLSIVLACSGGCAAGHSHERVDSHERVYTTRFHAEFVPQRNTAVASVDIRQSRDFVRSLRFSAPPSRYTVLGADGELDRHSDGFTWRPPAQGGVLRYEFRIDHRHNGGKDTGFDARMTDDWAILRADQLFPPATVRAMKDAVSQSSMTLSVPSDWAAETRYGGVDNQAVRIDNPERRFARPTGWMAVGRIGTRHQLIAGRRVTVAAPLGSAYRRLDAIAMINWNLPFLLEVFPQFPKRLLIVGAGDPMWRGGLSGSGSLYLHADRPLISENGTSSLIHELVHVGSRFIAGEGDDWIVEGIAEYFSLEIMRRSGTLTQRRFESSLAKLDSWSASSSGELLRGSRSTGATTARSALLMHALDLEVQRASDGDSRLDHVLAQLQSHRSRITAAALREAAAAVIGQPSKVLERALSVK